MDDALLRQMITDAGPLDDRIQAVAELAAEGAGWVVRFAQADVRIENLPNFGKIGFSVAMDGPATENAPTVFRALLAANVLWRENGGLRFGIGSSDNLIELSIELADTQATPALIAAYCSGLVEHAATWTLIFQGRLQAEAAPDVPHEFNANFIRL